MTGNVTINITTPLTAEFEEGVMKIDEIASTANNDNVTVKMEFIGEVSDEQRAMLEKLFAGTEAQNEQCCGEPDDCKWDDERPVSPEQVYDRLGSNNEKPEQATGGCAYGCDEPADEPNIDEIRARLDADPEVDPVRHEAYVQRVRGMLQDVLVTVPLDEQTVQYLLEADQALEDAQIHIADQAEKAALQAEEDLIVDEWRIAVLDAGQKNMSIASWSALAEDTRDMWRGRFYGNLEWLERFVKENA